MSPRQYVPFRGRSLGAVRPTQSLSKTPLCQYELKELIEHPSSTSIS